MKLTVEGISCVRGDYQVFANLGFTVSSGEALQLTGANGSGKSSLLRIVCGLLAPDRGTIRLEGNPDDTIVADLCHYLGHDNGLKAPMTARENLEFWGRVLGRTGAEPGAALRSVGLARVADLPVAYLSAGQKRRVALARLLVSIRPIWLLDEPTAALDAGSEALLGRLVDDHLRQGGIVIAATHMALPFTVDGALDLSALRPAPTERKRVPA